MVKWTAHAKARLRAIRDYIAQNSPLYAKRVSEELVQKTVSLDELPRKGHTRSLSDLGDRSEAGGKSRSFFRSFAANSGSI